LAYAARLLDHAPDASTRHYLAGFLGGVARQAHDRPLADAALRRQRGCAMRFKRGWRCQIRLLRM